MASSEKSPARNGGPLPRPGQPDRRHGARVVARQRPDLLRAGARRARRRPLRAHRRGHRASPSRRSTAPASPAGSGPAARPPTWSPATRWASSRRWSPAARSPPRTGLRLAVVRGRLMEEARRGEPGRDAGACSAAARRGARARRPPRADRSPTTTPPASWSSPARVEALDATRPARAARGGRKAIRLPVAGAFHSPRWRAAVGRFRAALDAVEFADAAVPVFSSSSPPRPSTTPATGLAAALTAAGALAPDAARLHDAGARALRRDRPRQGASPGSSAAPSTRSRRARSASRRRPHA